LTVNTGNCKLIRQVVPPAVGLAAKLKLFWLVTLLPWPLTFRSLNGVTGRPSCQFSASYALPFSTWVQERDGQTDDSHQRLMPPSYGCGT